MKKFYLFLLSTLLLPNLALAQYYGGGYGMMGGSSLFGFSGIFMIVFWIAIVFGLLGIFRHGGGCGMGHNMNTGNSSKSALDILKDRYAKGEIDKKQFEEIKKDLEK